MGPAPTDGLLKLHEAVAAFCDPARVAMVIAIEERLSDAQMESFHKVRLRPRPPDPQPEPVRRPNLSDPDYIAMNYHWKILLDEFRSLIADGKIAISGVKLEDATGERVVIPPAIVLEYVLDFRHDSFGGHIQPYRLVRASRAPPQGLATPRPAPIGAESVRDLTDEEILVLLEEYARRVVEEEGSKLQMPAKVSFIPIIRRKMAYRSRTGEMQSTLAAEAAALADWIKTKVNGHQTPKPATIENELREDYRRLKP